MPYGKNKKKPNPAKYSKGRSPKKMKKKRR